MNGLWLLSLLCLLLAAGPVDAQDGRPAGTLRGVFISDPPTLDPAQATDTTSSAVVRPISSFWLRSFGSSSSAMSPPRRVESKASTTGRIGEWVNS